MQDEIKSTSSIPNENRPITPWEYFGRDILYSIPLIGLIFAIICALDKNNINVRNHARSRLIFIIIWFGFLLLYVGMLAVLIFNATIIY